MGAENLKVLIVEDEAAHAEAIRRSFMATGAKAEILMAGTLQEYRSLVASSPPDIVLIDMNLPDGQAVEVLTSPPENGPFPVLIMTSYGNEQVAVEMMKAGALDYVVKSPGAFKDMPLTIVRALREWNLRKEHKRAGEELKASEEKFRELSSQFNALLNAIPDSITLISPDMKILWANRTAADRMALKPYAMAGQLCYSLWFNRNEPCEICPVRESLLSGNPAVSHITFNKKQIEVRAIPVTSQDGSVNIIRIGRDITEHRSLEDQLRHAQKMEAVGQLAGGVAHDFNNILTAIIGYGDIVLMKMAKDDPLRPKIEHIREAADRAAYLTHGLLAFSRKQMSIRKPVDLNEILKKTEKFLLRIIGEDIEFKTIPYNSPIYVLADSNQIEQVLINLATNARDAMPKGGAYTVRTEQVVLDDKFTQLHGFGQPGLYGLITVSDTGAGMDEQTRQRIFEPFFTTKEVGKGTGLGLSIIYGIIKQHDGYIDVSSEPGQGTIFRIYLPVTASGTQDDKKSLEAGLPDRGAEIILLAEDDVMLRKLAESVLKEYGYDVIAAVDGEDAVKKFMENKDSIRLLIFDLIMPKMSGKEAYDAIVKIRPNIKAIFASGYSPDIVRGRLSPEDNVTIVYKPVSTMDLLRIVRSVIDEDRT